MQRDPKVDDPSGEDLFEIGSIARVVQNLKLPNGNVKVMVEGVRRGKLLELEEMEGSFDSDVETYTIDYPVGE